MYLTIPHQQHTYHTHTNTQITIGDDHSVLRDGIFRVDGSVPVLVYCDVFLYVYARLQLRMIICLYVLRAYNCP